jgi:hypothetical protein
MHTTHTTRTHTTQHTHTEAHRGPQRQTKGTQKAHKSAKDGELPQLPRSQCQAQPNTASHC